MSIRTALGYADNDGAWVDVESHLRKKYIQSEADKKRREAARLRRRLFDCGGLDAAMKLIDDVFQDPTVKRLRKEVAPYARFDNALARIVRSRSRVYAKPPKARRVGGDENNARYQRVQQLTQHDAAMRLANILTSLSNDTFLLFRVRETDMGRQPRTDVLGPEDFFLICDPRDRTKLIGVGIDQTPDTIKPRETDPHWLVWTASESFHCDAAGRIIKSSIASNPFGRIPGIHIASDYRSTGLLDPMTGEDLVAAHLSAWLINTMLIKEAKSLNRQAAFVGETGNSPSGQSQDTEHDMVLAEGVGVTTIDRSVDLRQYRETADHIVERAAGNNGISVGELRHAGATSGYEIDLRRIPLEELREDQIAIFRPAEREFAEVQAAVLAVDLPELAFTMQDWWIDFAEIKRPVPDREKYETRKLKRSMGHSDPVTEALEDNPDFTPEMAAQWVADRMTSWLLFVEMARARVNAPADATVVNPGQAPEDNGAMGGRTAQAQDSTMTDDKPGDELDDDEQAA